MMEDSPSKRRRKTKLKEITATLSKEELIRRLKFNAQTLASIEQGVEDASNFDNLAAALVSTTILKHRDKDVRLYAATCLADILSLYAPEPPYDEDQLKDIFRVILQQLKGLENISGPSYKRHFYILESLAIVKSFSVCLELEDPELIIDLFKLFFTVVSPDHNARVTHHMLDIMTPLIQDAESLSQQVLNVIFVHLVEPRKTKLSASYKLACDLMDRCSLSIEPYVQIFFNNVLVLGNPVTAELEERVYDLIFELYKVNKNVLISALPQLEFKLKGNDESSRLETVKLLGKMFSHGDASLAASNKQLWQCYLGRFLDITPDVRIECIQMAKQFLLSSSQILRSDITEQLQNRCHDPDEKVRMETVMTICEAASEDYGLIHKSLLDSVTERMRDKKLHIRREAMTCMGKLYKKLHINNPQKRQEISWLPSKVLHLYQNTIEDRLCIERVYHGCFVPVSLESEERMQRLLHVFLSLDEISLKMLEGMLRFRAKVNTDLNALLEIYTGDSGDKQKNIFSKTISLARSIPEPMKSQEHIKKFIEMFKDDKFYQLVKLCTDTQQECPKIIKAVTDIIKKLTAKSPILDTVKALLDRACPMLIDAPSLVLLLRHIKRFIDGISDDYVDDDNLDEQEMILKGKEALKLVQILGEVQPSIFQSKQAYEILLLFIKHTNDSVVEITLKSLINVIHELESVDKSLLSCYQPVLTKLATHGTGKQSKYAVRCLYKMAKDSLLSTERMFKSLLDNMNFDFTTSRLRSTLAALGEIALLDPELFDSERKTIVRDFVVKEVLMKDRVATSESSSQDEEEWCSPEDLSDDTLIKIESIKLLTKWLLGLQDDHETKAMPVFRLLTTLIEHDGDLTGAGNVSAPNRSHLRVVAGNALIKLLQNKHYVDVISLDQYQQLGFLIQDSSVEVRDKFTNTLNKGLESLQLPLSYMAYFALVAIDPAKQRKLKVKQMIIRNAQLRRDYSKSHSTAAARPYSILPEYSLPYVVHLLAHHPDLVLNDFEKLTEFKEYLWFFLEPIMGTKAENYSFLKKLLENIKQTKDKQEPDNNEANEKMYAVCDLAVGCIMNKTSSFTLKDFPGNLVLPKKLFIEEKSMVNTRSYLPKGFVVSPKKSYKPTSELIKGVNLKSPQKKSQGTKRANNTVDDDEVEEVSPKKKTRVASTKTTAKSPPKSSPVKNGKRSSPVKRKLISPKKSSRASSKKSPTKPISPKKSSRVSPKKSPTKPTPNKSPKKSQKQSPVKKIAVSSKKSPKKTVKEKKQIKMDAFVNGRSKEEEVIPSDGDDEEMGDEKPASKPSPKKTLKKAPAKITRMARTKPLSPVKINGSAGSEEISSSANSSQTSIAADEKPNKLIIRRRKQRTRR